MLMDTIVKKVVNLSSVELDMLAQGIAWHQSQLPNNKAEYLKERLAIHIKRNEELVAECIKEGYMRKAA